jgi:hypothetical protein
MNGQIEPIVGRYVHVDIGGVMHRIYFEENGCTPPAPTTGSGVICCATTS